MKFLLTSDGISNTSIHNALVELLGKPMPKADATAPQEMAQSTTVVPAIRHQLRWSPFGASRGRVTWIVSNVWCTASSEKKNRTCVGAWRHLEGEGGYGIWRFHHYRSRSPRP